MTGCMKLNCPDCGTTFDLIQAMEDADGRRFVDLIKELPPITIKPFVRYLRLFKPGQQSLRWSRMLKLAHELHPNIKDAVVMRNGQAYVVTGQQWADVMTSLVDTPPKNLRLPLKTHGYLLEVLATSTEKKISKKEQETENRKRQITRNHNNSPSPISSVINKTGSMPPANWKKDAFKPSGGKQ